MNKPRLSLLDLPTTAQLVHAMAVLDMPVRYSELVDRILYHTLHLNEGEEFDRESGVHHAAAAAAYAYFLLGRVHFRDGVDDRAEAEPKGVKLVWPDEP